MRRSHCHQAQVKDLGAFSRLFFVWFRLANKTLPSATKEVLGICVRDSPCSAIRCFVASCSFNDLELDALQTHIQADHRDSRTVSIAVTLFSEPNPSVASVVGGHSVEGHDTRTSEGEDSGGIHEGESSVGTGDSGSDSEGYGAFFCFLGQGRAG